MPIKVREEPGRIPLIFESNVGQADSEARFLAHSGAYSVFLTSQEAVLVLRSGEDKKRTLRIRPSGGNPEPQVVALEQLPGRSNYFFGENPKVWRTGIPHFARVEYRNVYPDIDLIYHGERGELEFDFIVGPGADLDLIALEFEGADSMEIDHEGDLILQTAGAEVRQLRPVVYQIMDGAKVYVAGNYVLNDDHRVGFRLGDYDSSRPLVIDPVLSFSTYFGGSGDDFAEGIAVDASGNIYFSGDVFSADFPTSRPVQRSFGGGCCDAFVAKLSPTGSLIYATYLGGSERDFGLGAAVDSSGNAYVTGYTNSADFPTASPLQRTNPDPRTNDAFIAKLNASGSALVYSTYLGGSGDDLGWSLGVDASGNAYVAGETSSADFPTVQALQTYGGGSDAFVAKLNSTGTAFGYSTYLGGGGDDIGFVIAVDSSGKAYVTGWTGSRDFPSVNALQQAFAGGTFDTFVAQISESIIVSQSTFTVPDRGGASLTTGGSDASVAVGYGRIQPNAANTTPAGLAIFGFRQGNVLVTEAGVPASSLIQSGRIYAEINGPVNTGLAIANPNNQAATISFFFTDASGRNFRQDTTVVPANGQLARFLDQDPFNGGSSVFGSLTFSSSLPVAVIALRGFTNERMEFLITTLPVAELSAAVGETVIFPHFADGGGWTTQIVLVNPTEEALSGTVQFLGQGTTSTSAQPVTLTVDGNTASTFAYSIAPRSSHRFRTVGAADSVRVGSVRIVPRANSRTPSGLGIFSFRKDGVTVSEAGVPALRAARAFRTYVESIGNFIGGEVGAIQTGVAIANPSTTAATVNFELTTLLGTSMGLTGTAPIPGNGQIALFLNQIQGFGTLPPAFQGLLRVSTASAPGISMVGLRGRYN